MRFTPVVVLSLLVCLLPPRMATAEPPAPLAERAAILEIEMRRGPAKDLARFLKPGVHPLTRWYAIRALGRIGDRGAAPKMLGDLLDAGAKPLTSTLWAAGIAQTDKLYDPIVKHLESKEPAVVAAAAEALGWTGKADAINDLTPLLASPDAAVRRGALRGLARLRPEGVLERIAPFVHDKDASVQRAAGFACWLIAGSRKRAAKAQDEAWDGNRAVAKIFLPLLADKSADRQMDGLRVLASLLPKDLAADGILDQLAPLLSTADARVVQDVIWRLLAPRKTAETDQRLVALLGHADLKVREMVIVALAERESEPTLTALRVGLKRETDPLVREAYVTALAKRGDPGPWMALTRNPKRSDQVELAVRQITDVSALLASKNDEALPQLFAMAKGATAGIGLHPAAMMALLSGLEAQDDPSIEVWLKTLLPSAGPFDVDDPYVASAVISLIGTKHYWKRFADLRAACGPGSRDLLHDEVRLALAGAFGDLAADEAASDENKAWIAGWLRRAMYGDASAWVRAKARGALEKMGAVDVPEDDVLSPTDWKGLPRPSTKILGLDLTEGGEWLDASEILRVADAIFSQAPRLRFTTTQGSFDVALDPDAAPAHCVSALLAVAAGVYQDTRWHRVVPNFVIQGGDPHGHGGGNGGWFVPDEITPRSYVRGALGMPKSRKDDGGCQLFFMHSSYLPLDERYTNYGTVISGLDVIDKIRVGDRILKAEIITK